MRMECPPYIWGKISSGKPIGSSVPSFRQLLQRNFFIQMGNEIFPDHFCRLYLLLIKILWVAPVNPGKLFHVVQQFQGLNFKIAGLSPLRRLYIILKTSVAIVVEYRWHTIVFQVQVLRLFYQGWWECLHDPACFLRKRLTVYDKTDAIILPQGKRKWSR